MLKKHQTKVMEFPKSLYLYFGLNIVYLIIIILFPSNKIIMITSLLVLGVLEVYIWLKYKKIVSTYQWVKTMASVKKVSILQSKCPIVECFCFNQKPYRLDIVYEYQYEGELYISNQYAIDPICNYHYGIEEVKKIKERLIKSKKIDIFINPRKPNQSVILQGVSKDFAPSYLFVLVIYGFLYFSFLWMIR